MSAQHSAAGRKAAQNPKTHLVVKSELRAWKPTLTRQAQIERYLDDWDLSRLESFRRTNDLGWGK